MSDTIFVEERAMSQTAAWLVPIVAGVREVCWAVGLLGESASAEKRLAGIAGLRVATPA